MRLRAGRSERFTQHLRCKRPFHESWHKCVHEAIQSARNYSGPDGRTDRDNATATLHVLQRRLRRDEYAADVDVDREIHLFQGRLLERFRNGRAGIVHQDIQSAEGRDGLFDRGLDGVRICGIS